MCGIHHPRALSFRLPAAILRILRSGKRCVIALRQERGTGVFIKPRKFSSGLLNDGLRNLLSSALDADGRLAAESFGTFAGCYHPGYWYICIVGSIIGCLLARAALSLCPWKLKLAGDVDKYLQSGAHLVFEDSGHSAYQRTG